METKSNHNPLNNTTTSTSTSTSHNHKRAMDKFKEALLKFAHSNPTEFPNDAGNSYQRLIEQRFSQFFPDFRTPNHPPYAAMIHTAILELNKKGGSSEEAISKYVKQKYFDLPWAHTTLLKYHLQRLCDLNELCMTRKQCYLLATTDSDPISSCTSEEQLKGKQNSESGKKRSRHHKKQKSKQDSESSKTSSKQRNKYKEKEERKLDLQESNKQLIEVFQEQDQVIQLMNEVADEQENIAHNGSRFLNMVIPEMEEGGVFANAAEQNQSEIKKDSMGQKVYKSRHFNKKQSVELGNDKEQHGTKKAQLKRKRMSNSPRRNSKRGKKNKKTPLQAFSEASLKQPNKVTDGHLHEQNQMIYIEIKDHNVVGQSVDAGAQNQLERWTNGVVEEVYKNGEITKESHPDNSAYISFGEIEMNQNPQLLQLKSKHSGKQGWTRSQIKTMSKKDSSVKSGLINSSGCAYLPKEKQVTQIVTWKDTKQVSSTVSTQMNVQRAKLRSSQKNTGHLETVESPVAPLLQIEPRPKSPSPSLEKPLKELLKPKTTKLSPRLEPATVPSSTKVVEPGSSQQYQQPDELKDQPKRRLGRPPKHKELVRPPKHKRLGRPPKYKRLCRPPKQKGRGRPPKSGKLAAIPKKDQQSADKCEARSQAEDEVVSNLKSTDILEKDQECHKSENVEKDEVLCNLKSTSADTCKQGQQSNEGHDSHNMMRRSSRKKKMIYPSC